MSIFKKLTVVGLVIAALFYGSLKQLLGVAAKANGKIAKAGESHSGGTGI